MEKNITIKGIEFRYTELGCIFKTDNDSLYVIEQETMDSIIEKKRQLETKLKGSLYLGNNLKVDNEYISKVSMLLNNGNSDTGAVMILKKELVDLMESSKRSGVSSNMVLSMQKRMEKMADTYQASIHENKKLKMRIDELLNMISMNEKEKESCQNAHDSGQSTSFLDAREKMNQKRKDAKDAKAALILDLAVSGYKANQIQSILIEQHETEVALSTIYRALSVRKAEDRQRIVTLYQAYIAGKGKCSLDDVLKWYESTRNKKLKLVSAQDEEALNSFGEEYML